MEKYLFAPLLARKLAQDDLFRLLFARLLRAVAILVALTSVILFFFGWKEIFDMSHQAMIGGIVFQLTLVLATYLAVHLILLRASEVKQHSDRPAPIDVSAATVRLAGEVFGFAAALLGAGGGVLVWFAGRESGYLLEKVEVFFPFLKAGPASFLGGAALIVKGVGYGTLALLLGYLLAEALLLLPKGSVLKQSVVEKL